MFRNLTPAVRSLLITNFVIFLLEQATGGDALLRFALWPLDAARAGGAPFAPYQLVTYAFLHGGWAHIIFNMLALYMFGPDVERLFGTRRFLVYYFACVVGAALTQLAVLHWFAPGSVEPTVGASGGIFGVLLAFGISYPRRPIIIVLFPIPMPAWVAVLLYGLSELAYGVFGMERGVAHFAHLGGMAAGFLIIRYWRLRDRGAPRIW